MELLWRSGDFWFLFSVCELKIDLLLFSLLLFYFFFLITLSVKVVMVVFFCGLCIIIELNAIYVKSFELLYHIIIIIIEVCHNK